MVSLRASFISQRSTSAHAQHTACTLLLSLPPLQEAAAASAAREASLVEDKDALKGALAGWVPHHFSRLFPLPTLILRFRLKSIVYFLSGQGSPAAISSSIMKRTLHCQAFSIFY